VLNSLEVELMGEPPKRIKFKKKIGVIGFRALP
jgi:hypothetical protein